MGPEHPHPDRVPRVVGFDETRADETGADYGGGDRDHADAEDESEGEFFGAAEAHGGDDEHGDDEDWVEAMLVGLKGRGEWDTDWRCQREYWRPRAQRRRGR